MIKFMFEPEGLAARKKEIIQRLGEPPNADILVPMRDREIVADLVFSGIEKMMATLNTHLEASATCVSTSDAMQALLITTAFEAEMSFSVLVHDIGRKVVEDMMSQPGGAEYVLRRMMELNGEEGQQTG